MYCMYVFSLVISYPDLSRLISAFNVAVVKYGNYNIDIWNQVASFAYHLLSTKKVEEDCSFSQVSITLYISTRVEL